MSYQIEDHIQNMRKQTKSLIVNINDENQLGSNTKNSKFTVEDYIYRARLAEKALRYEDMLIQMRNVLDLKKKLTADERNLLVVAYKNAVTTRRTAIRHLSTYCKKIDEIKLTQICEQYREEIANELWNLCQELLTIVKDVLTPNARNDAEQIAFYERMKGDFIRYEIEIASINLKESLQNEANHCYLNAKELAENNLPAYHPVRVGIMLNYSVFCFNSKSKTENALKIAKQAYEEALADYDQLHNEEMRRDAHALMKSLQNNMKHFAKGPGSDIEEI
ncbi:unnamed protein product [Adineta steineri]|uniref:14-3-3 domain-containing protein n=1 Tax=Adineta steineri TaxID=433720 RepID=A0A819CZU2_9BILA|nr:unnamed protein product [Adineta steineri]CAF0988296.1 unnamed protein product [Adineta steineri]CAF1085663.1 unnamed protein product [Adineta steineri]CAF1107753.1 unnamed protein product [Adineta steineri]CAF1190156.1 unnamed protein product [Adineta steineri]